jgi:LPS-assembly lipoprotein
MTVAAVMRRGRIGSPQRRMFVATLLTGWVTLSLPGCGFHLRGSVRMPEIMDVTYLKGVDAYSEFGTSLVNALIASDVRVTDDPEEAGAVLRFTKNRYTRRVLSVNSAGKVQEYDVRYDVEFGLSDAQGNIVVPLQSLHLSRSYLFDPEDVLAKEREDEQIRRVLRDDMIRLIMHRLSAASGRLG